MYSTSELNELFQILNLIEKDLNLKGLEPHWNNRTIEIVQLRQSLSHHSSTIVNSLGIALCYLDRVYLLTLIDIECEIQLEFLDVNLYCTVDISIDIEPN